MATTRRASALRAVAEDETAVPKKSVAQAAKSNDQRELLVAMRDRIAETVSKPDCPPRDLASLTKRLQDIARDIAAIDAVEAGQMASDGPISTDYDSTAI